MGNISFGVILATYNGEEYIEEQLESILKQTYPVEQIIISDDGSFDNTKNIVKRIITENGQKDIRIIDHKSTGNISDNFCNAYNYLINVDYIFFCDQDDKWEQDKVKIFFDSISERNYPDLVFSDAIISNADLSVRKDSLIKELGNGLYRDLINTNTVFEFHKDIFNCKRILRWNILTGMNACVKYSFFKTVMPIPKGILHDKWTMLCSFFGGRVCYIPKKTAYYRQHGANSVGIKKKKSILDKKKALEKYLQKMIDISNAFIVLQKKYDNINNIEEKKILYDFSSFYENRCKILQKKRVMQVVINALKGLYDKYTYNKYRHIINDLAFCIMFKN